MIKYYTENKMMYFQVTESEEEKGKFEIHAFYKSGDNYEYERMIPEDTYNDLLKARSIAEALSWAYNWGVDSTEEILKEELLLKIKKILD